MRWGRSLFDWHSHAVNDTAERPGGALKATCGQWLVADTVLDDQPERSPCPRCVQHITGGPGPEAVPNEGVSYVVAALTVIDQLHQLRGALVKAEALADQTAGLTGGQLADQLEPLAQRAGDHVEQATRTLLVLLDACIEGLGPCRQHWPTTDGPGAP